LGSGKWVRSFIAFDIINEEVLQGLTQMQKLLIETGNDLKVVEAANIHVTLRFLGELSPDLIESVGEEMAKVVFKPFKIELRGLGVFKDFRYITVVWVGIGRGVDELRIVYNQLEPRLRKLGIRPDDKGFSPHITIARVMAVHNRERLVNLVKGNAEHVFGIFEGNSLRLKKSVLTPMGPVYSTLKEVRPIEG